MTASEKLSEYFPEVFVDLREGIAEHPLHLLFDRGYYGIELFLGCRQIIHLRRNVIVSRFQFGVLFNRIDVDRTKRADRGFQLVQSALNLGSVLLRHLRISEICGIGMSKLIFVVDSARHLFNIRFQKLELIFAL